MFVSVNLCHGATFAPQNIVLPLPNKRKTGRKKGGGQNQLIFFMGDFYEELFFFVPKTRF